MRSLTSPTSDWTGMYPDELGMELLRQNLAATGATVDHLKKEVGVTFGQPRLIGATGSFLEHFDIQDSFIDVHVFVDTSSVTDIPIPSFTLGQGVFLTFLNTEWVTAAAAGVLSGVPPSDGWRRRADWYADRRTLLWLGRVAAGPVIEGDEHWRELRVRLREAYPTWAARWWRSECLRRLTAARMFAALRPAAAVQRYCDAGLAALEHTMALAGESTVWPQWLGAKVERSGTAAHRLALQRFLALPVDPAATRSYFQAAEDLIASLCQDGPPARDPHLALFLQPDVSVWRFRQRAIVQRHGMTGVEVDDASITTGWRPDKEIWSGRSSELDGAMVNGVLENLFWVAVSEECAT